MSLVKENWQTTKPTIRERSKFMLNNHLFSDVKFVARGPNGETESKQVIPAHKFVLAISSPVFEAMFYGELAETTDSIELPDCEYDSLLELFRYMYSDEVILSGSNVMGVYTYQLSRLRRESHACGLKTSISRRLTLAGIFLTPD